MRAEDFDAAIVDLDGTMVDTLGDFELALTASLAELGLPPVSRDFIAGAVGRGSRNLLTRVLVSLDQGLDRLDALSAAYQHHYRIANGRASTVFPGVQEGLAAMRRAGWRLACLTNKPTAFAAPLLTAKGLDRYFEHMFGGDAFLRSKPDPLPVIETCRALGASPARTLVVGDSVNDAQAARAAGCSVVLVRYGYNHGAPVEAAGADLLLDRLDDLLAR